MGAIYNNAGGIIIRNRKLLVVREKDHSIFVVPGGGIEKDETPEMALIRELQEEINILCNVSDLKLYASFSGPATNRKNIIKMKAFFVDIKNQEIKPTGDIEKLQWVTSVDIEKISLGWILKNRLILELKSKNLID